MNDALVPAAWHRALTLIVFPDRKPAWLLTVQREPEFQNTELMRITKSYANSFRTEPGGFVNNQGAMTISPFQSGVRAIAPLLPSVVPFGIMAGIAARDAGLDVWASLGMSVIIFAGASQLAAAQLMGEGAVPAVIVLTALVINLRMVMYSASLAPHLAGLPRRWKWPLAYLVTDQAYAVTIHRMLREPDMRDRHWYFLGAAFPLWAMWVLATLAGIAVGAALPGAWRLEFAVPLIFLALLVPAVHDRPTLAAAGVGAGVAVLAHRVPINLGLITGALCGVVAGVMSDLHREQAAA